MRSIASESILPSLPAGSFSTMVAAARLLSERNSPTASRFLTGCRARVLVSTATIRSEISGPSLGMDSNRNNTRLHQPKLLGGGLCILGEQSKRIHSARVWILPNPSGLNANYRLPDQVRLFT